MIAAQLSVGAPLEVLGELGVLLAELAYADLHATLRGVTRCGTDRGGDSGLVVAMKPLAVRCGDGDAPSLVPRPF